MKQPQSTIRYATLSDLPAILAIYAAARRFMAENGNASQWGTTYPQEALLRADIAAQRLYVLERDGMLRGAFMLLCGAEPTYAHIEGAWPDDEPYCTIHRIAGDGAEKGVFAQCLAFCESRCARLRIDTHPNNLVMQHLIEKHGFTRCGIVHMEDGSPRIAYARGNRPAAV